MNEIIQSKRAELADLCVKHRVRRLAAFGSATSRRFDSTSDLDFLVEFKPISPAEQASCYFSLLEDLESLFGRSIDLVERAAIRNPYFRSAVEETQVDLYAAA